MWHRLQSDIEGTVGRVADYREMGHGFEARPLAVYPPDANSSISVYPVGRWWIILDYGAERWIGVKKRHALRRGKI